MWCRSCSRALMVSIATGMSSADRARTRIWSTFVNRTGWGVLASWLGDGCVYSFTWALAVGYSWLRVFTVAAAAGALWFVVVADSPATRYLMVVHGASRVSSWSRPIMLAPLWLSTPTTRNDTF